ncbi:MAG: hypothetical protein ACI4LP_09785 [Anaerovoracaceae bacterium]
MTEDNKTLTMTEFIYIAEILGATELFGISDPYYGLSASEKRIVKNEAECSLEEKGLLIRGFGKSELKESDVKELVKTCIFCDRLAVLDYIVGGEQKSILYYIKDSIAVRVENMGEPLCLKRTLPKRITSEIEDILMSENSIGIFSFSATNFAANVVENITVEKEDDKYVKLSLDNISGNVLRTALSMEELINELHHIEMLIDMEV